MVVGTVSVTGLAYLDAVSKIDDKQDQIDDLNVLITQQDETIEKLSTTVTEVASEIGGITVNTPSRPSEISEKNLST